MERHREALRLQFPLPDAPMRQPRRGRALLAAALAGALVALLYALDPAYDRDHYETAIGGHRIVALRDGSRITLDTQTRVTVEWHLRSRRAQLDRGQALFDVAHAAQRPFTAAAGPIVVRVLGTQFDLRHEGDRTAVGVLRGHVAVRDQDGNRSRELLPGQRLLARGAIIGAVEAMDASVYTAWQHKRLIFEQASLATVIRELQRYLPNPVSVADERLQNEKVSGVLAVDNAGAALALLPAILSTPAQLRRRQDGSLVIEPAPPQEHGPDEQSESFGTRR